MYMVHIFVVFFEARASINIVQCLLMFSIQTLTSFQHTMIDKRRKFHCESDMRLHIYDVLNNITTIDFHCFGVTVTLFTSLMLLFKILMNKMLLKVTNK